ncbi:hypothetical protein TGMAS_297340 [Toxoplasma gondii MAS]|uniref:Uncharacterized protein n=2 Tax=Toxoplasma gondii TaxID=5811 RepID=A0A086PHD5_TOXGO|nr:hypothetical protein TGMAS_297340 [Toxoplasma gondii MAS]PUA84708.1 hypothetical protein TGBR9_297340 [Toxoplasma gondii TgCATBr9]
MECLPPVCAELISVNESQRWSGGSADPRNSTESQEIFSTEDAKSISDASLWTDILSVSIPEDLCKSSSVPEEEMDSEGRVTGNSPKQRLLTGSSGLTAAVTKPAPGSPSELLVGDETIQTADCEPGHDTSHAASRMEAKAGCRPRERALQSTACLSNAMSGVSRNREAKLSGVVRTGKGVGGSGRGRLSLGAVGRQLLLDRIRTRYHTNAVYYSALLRDKYNSTISKLPFFTVSLLHQLADDFEIDTSALLNQNVENAGAPGGYVRLACKSRGVDRTRRTSVPVAASAAIRETESSDQERAARRKTTRVKRKSGRNLQQTKGTCLAGLRGCSVAEMDQGLERFAGMSGSTGNATSGLCTPTARNRSTEDAFEATAAGVEMLGRKVFNSSRDTDSISAWLLSTTSTSKESQTASSEEGGELCRSAVCTPGTGSTESVPSSPLRSNSGANCASTADIGLGKSSEAEIDCGEKQPEERRAFSRICLEQNSSVNANRASWPALIEDVESVCKGVVSSVSGTATNRKGAGTSAVFPSNGQCLKRSCRPDIEAIEALLDAARRGEPSVSLESFKSRLLRAGLSLPGSEHASKKSKILQATASESTTIPSSPSTSTTAAVELLTAAELWSTTHARARSMERKGIINKELSTAAGFGGGASTTRGISRAGIVSGLAYGKGNCWTGEDDGDDDTPSDERCRMLAALSRHGGDPELQSVRFPSLASAFPAAAATGLRDSDVNEHVRRTIGHSGSNAGGCVGVTSFRVRPRRTTYSQFSTNHALCWQTIDPRMRDASDVLAVTVGDIASFLRTQRMRRCGGRSAVLGGTSSGRLQGKRRHGKFEDFSSMLQSQRDLMPLRERGNEVTEDLGNQDVSGKVFLYQPPFERYQQNNRSAAVLKDVPGDRVESANGRAGRETKCFEKKLDLADSRDDAKSTRPWRSNGPSWQAVSVGIRAFLDAELLSRKDCDSVGVLLADTRVRTRCSGDRAGRSEPSRQLAGIVEPLSRADRKGVVAENSDLKNVSPCSETTWVSQRVRGGHAHVEGGSMVPQRVEPVAECGRECDSSVYQSGGSEGGATVTVYPGEDGNVSSPGDRLWAPAVEATCGEHIPDNADVKSIVDGSTDRAECSSSVVFMKLDHDSNDETSAGSPVPESAAGNNDDGVGALIRESPTEASGDGEMQKAGEDDGNSNGVCVKDVDIAS